MLDNEKTRALAANIVDPIAKGLLRLGLKANHVTVVGALTSSLISLITIPNGKFAVALFLLVPLVAADLLDGTMARLSNSVSKSGAFLDSVMDRVTDFALFVSFTLWAISNNEQTTTYLGFSAMTVSGLIPYIRAKAEAINIPCNIGILERGERILVLAAATLASALGFSQSITIALGVVTVLGAITVLQRIYHVLKSVS
jgi:CDP-diacylglycerol--glycerol-3-phosphate 3-phosphatidyltransferase